MTTIDSHVIPQRVERQKNVSISYGKDQGIIVNDNISDKDADSSCEARDQRQEGLSKWYETISWCIYDILTVAVGLIVDWLLWQGRDLGNQRISDWMEPVSVYEVMVLSLKFDFVICINLHGANILIFFVATLP